MATDSDTTEIWARIGVAPDYAVSTHGRIKRISQSAQKMANTSTIGKVLKTRPRGSSKYLGATVSVNGKRIYFYVQQAVLEAFVGPRPSPYHEAAHWDGNRHNNHISNLRWATKIENAADKARHGTQVKGEQVSQSKLTEVQVREILQIELSNAKTAELYGVTKGLIGHIRRRKAWAWVQL